MRILFFTFLASLLTLGCSTLPDNAPNEFVEAEKSVDEMDDKDVDELLPQTSERAHNQFDTAVSLLEESNEAEGIATRDMAISKASEAKDTADGAILIHERLMAWDANQSNFQDALAMIRGDNEAVVVAAAVSSPFAKLRDKEVVSTVAFFETDDASSPIYRNNEIESLAEILKLDSSWNVILTGHADPRGPAEYNKDLAMKRAETIAVSLMDMGVQDYQIAYEGAGETSRDTTDQAKLQLDRNVRAKLVF